MIKLFIRVKGFLMDLFISIKPKIIKGSKAVYGIIRKLILIILLIVFFVVPFLNSCLNNFIAKCIWYPSMVVIAILLIRVAFRNDKLNRIETVVDHVGKWSFWVPLFIFLSIFVLRYYKITYVWLWVIFFVVAIYMLFFFLSLFSFNLKHHELTQKEKQKLSINVVKYILLYWLFDLTYMGIFNNWFWITIIFGTLAVTLVFYNLALALFNIVESLRIWLVFELLFGMGTAVYLIYIIPNQSLQSILVAIVAALFGGLFTLIGVAWTIKKGDIDRKEDERKKNIPYMKVVQGIKGSSEVCARIYKGLDLSNATELEKVEENSLYLITIKDCIMKNISESNIILQGMFFGDKRYDFSEQVILEKGEVCKIRTTGNHCIAVPNLESTLNLIVKDTMDNVYSIECKLNYAPVDRVMTITVEECEYAGFEFEGVVGSVKLPTLMDI